MRHYAKIPIQFWLSQQEIKPLPVETRLSAIYLMSAPHSNPMGIYYLPIVLMAHDIGISTEAASKAIQQLCDLNFCEYDFKLDYIWVVETAEYEFGMLKSNDNQIKKIHKFLKALPPLSFLTNFFVLYKEQLHLALISI